MSGISAYAAAVAAQRRPGRESTDGSLDLRELVRLGTLAASSHNTQPWTFRLRPRAIEIRPDFSRRCAVADADDGHLFKSLGCAAENLIHAAAAQGHAAQLSFEAADPCLHIAFERTATLRAGPLFHAIPRRQCTKRRYDGRALPVAAMAQLEKAGSGEGVRTLLIADAATREAIIEYVREGDLEQLRDRGFRQELIGWMRFNDAAAMRSGDGLSSRTAGLPPLPDALARRIIGLALSASAQARTDTKNIRSSPLLAVLVARQDTPAAWVDVGRAYQRLALQATALGIRSAFINPPIEVRRLRPQLNGRLGLQNETALLMLRLGYAAEAPFSLRRPLDAVLTGS